MQKLYNLILMINCICVEIEYRVHKGFFEKKNFLALRYQKMLILSFSETVRLPLNCTFFRF